MTEYQQGDGSPEANAINPDLQAILEGSRNHLATADERETNEAATFAANEASLTPELRGELVEKIVQLGLSEGHLKGWMRQYPNLFETDVDMPNCDSTEPGDITSVKKLGSGFTVQFRRYNDGGLFVSGNYFTVSYIDALAHALVTKQMSEWNDEL